MSQTPHMRWQYSFMSTGQPASVEAREEFLSLIAARNNCLRQFGRDGIQPWNLQANPRIDAEDVAIWLNTKDVLRCESFIELAVKLGVGAVNDRVLTFNSAAVEAIHANPRSVILWEATEKFSRRFLLGCAFAAAFAGLEFLPLDRDLDFKNGACIAPSVERI